MPSASMYASPYIHKEPPPKIYYPDMFTSLGRITCRYIFDSKILALCTLLLGLGLFVVIGMVITPFWFELQFSDADGTFGRGPVKKGLTINSGIFFLDEGHFTNLGFLNKYSGRDVVPKTLAIAQVCSVFGICLLVGCFAGSLMLTLRRFASATGTLFLAGATTLSAFLLVMMILFCGILLGMSNCEPDNSCYTENQVWRMIPIYSQMYRIEPHLTPYVAPSWAFYIAIIGCLLVVAGAVMTWIEAIITVKNLTGIRYQQLRETRDPYAHDINPMDGKKYVYAPPMKYGPSSYGMQPVVHTNAPYPQPPLQQPHIGFVTGPSKPSYRAPSESGSSAQGTMEIDL